MGTRWVDSADKHDVEHDDALHAMIRRVIYIREFDDSRIPGGRKPDLFIGPDRDEQKKQTPKGVSDEEQRLADELSAWAESDEFEVPNGADVIVSDSDDQAGRDLLESIVGAEEVARVVDRGGRPGLSGRGNGPSPKRQVRLPHEIDARLVAKAEAEHRDVSDVMREAITEYLAHAS